MRQLQARVQAALDEAVATGAEVGLQAAVFSDGELVADAVSGVADPRTGAPVTTDTLFWAASTGKGIASAVAHVLAERGDVDYDARLVDVWPEFGAHGKDRVTLRHVLLHTAGVPGLPADTTVTDLCDWDRMCAVVADEKPWWEPGTAFGYHAKTFGFLLGEYLRRATGRTISALLRELVTGPLGVEDEVHFGVPGALLPRVAWQVGTAPDRPEPGTPLDRAMPAGVVPDADYANRPDVLTSDIPSEGTMTARGAARVYAALLGFSDVPLVSAGRRAAMAEVAVTGPDRVMGFPSQWAFGFSPHRPGGGSRPGSTFGMVGMNGSAAYADIDSGVAVAVLRNRFGGGMTTVETVDRIVAETKGSVTMDTRIDARFSDPDTAATPWEETLRVLEAAELFWVTTVRADGRPHVTPLVAVWLDGALHFSTGESEQKAVNLRGNPHVVLTTGRNDWQDGLDVIVEGEAVQVTDATVLARLAEAWTRKWDGRWKYQARDGGFAHEDGGKALVFAVAPTKVLAFGKGPFTHTTHRF